MRLFSPSMLDEEFYEVKMKFDPKNNVHVNEAYEVVKVRNFEKTLKQKGSLLNSPRKDNRQ